MTRPPTPPLPGSSSSGSRSSAPARAVSPPARVGPRKLIALAVAAVLFAGVVGLVVAAVVTDDDSLSASRLQQPLAIDGPAVAVDAGSSTGEPAGAAEPAEAAGAAPRPPAPDGSIRDEPTGDDGVAAVPVDSIESPTDDADLPPLGSSPVELPDLVAPPRAVPAVAASAIGDLDPEAIDGLAGWNVVTRDDDYVSFTDGAVVVEVFAVRGAAQHDSGVVLTAFLDDRLAGGDVVSVSETAPQAAARSEFSSVAGAEYMVITSRQQGTRTMSGAAIAAVGSPDSAVVVVTSREGRASTEDLAADTSLLHAVLAHVDVDVD